jgi:MYXO-CTERM domain-containing protein
MRISALAILCSMVMATGWVTTAAAAPTCKAPRVLIVLDRSSSMVTGMVGSKTKWSIAKDALSKVLKTYETSVDFGLMLFPDPNQCGGGSVKQGIGPQNAAPILSHLIDPPKSGNWTPMAQSLDIAAKVKNLQDSAYKNYVLLITDGWQWCSPYVASSRFLPVNSTTNLTSLGITTYVVGFGDSVDTLTLNKMASAAKTKVSSKCNVAGTDPKAKNNCYYQANDHQALLTALQNIAKLITAEQCDGLDNDCDGAIDEGLQQTCSSACGAGTETCTAGSWIGCSAPQPSPEICDGKDNDCDGSVDEGCGCTAGQTQACGSTAGQCTAGTQTCLNGIWGACTGGSQPGPETCDGVDNDCDGQSDEGLTQACQTACGVGTAVCTNGAFGSCTAPQPSAEICDGLDNDCDGTPDNASGICSDGKICVNGACQDPPSGLNNARVEDAAGCDCAVGEAAPELPALPLLGLTLLAALVLMRRRD